MYFYCCQSAWAVFYSKKWWYWETHCFSQEALDGGAVAAQAAHNYCHWYTFLLPGHKPHFFSHWKSYKISSSIFAKHLVKNCSEKKKVLSHGRLWRPTWTDWLKKWPTMQVRSFMESKNVINLKSLHSIPPLKIDEISKKIFDDGAIFITPTVDVPPNLQGY